MKDQVIVITGGSSGLGKAMARHLKDEGAEVVITGRDEKKLSAVAHELGVTSIHSDVSKDEDIERLYKIVDEQFGKLDVLINNAGIAGRAKVEDLTREAMDEVYQVNVYGAAMMAAHAAKRFKKQNHGAIVNIASTASLKGYPTGSIYCSSKFALRALTQCWQAELRPHNVRVIQINPSEVPTAFGKADREEKELEEKKLTPDEIAHATVSALKMDARGFIPELTVWATNPF